MAESRLENPWVFTAVNVVLWVAGWGLIHSLFFDDGLFMAVLQAGLAGIVFSMLYRYLN